MQEPTLTIRSGNFYRTIVIKAMNFCLGMMESAETGKVVTFK